MLTLGTLLTLDLELLQMSTSDLKSEAAQPLLHAHCIHVWSEVQDLAAGEGRSLIVGTCGDKILHHRAVQGSREP